MAIFSPGPAVAEVRGSIGGTVFSRNTHGAYMRYRAVPVNTNTARQTAVRQTMELLQAYFRDTLTQTQQDAWKDYASQMPRPNKLGFSGLNSAANFFIAVNSLRLLAAQSILDDPPPTNGMGAPPIITLTCDTTDGLKVGAVTPALAAGDILQFQVSPPKPFTVNFFGSGFTSTIYKVGVSAAPYTLKASGAVAIGQRYFVKMRFLSALGRIASPIQLAADCTA